MTASAPFEALRLKPGDDLAASLAAWVKTREISGAAVLTCVGSLRRAVIRLADRDTPSAFAQKLEILTLSGTLGAEGHHLHIALADGDGRCIGGHLMPGCEVYTTAEIVLAVVPGKRFLRRQDPETGYRELVVEE